MLFPELQLFAFTVPILRVVGTTRLDKAASFQFTGFFGRTLNGLADTAT